MEPLRQKGSSMASWSTFIFKNMDSAYESIWKVTCPLEVFKVQTACQIADSMLC